MFGYTVQEKFFNSPYTAFIFAAHNYFHDSVVFYANDHIYDQASWSVDPQESWDELLRCRATNLRNNYECLILFYSGGTDSQTIYNTMIRHKIRIDEIIIGYSENDSGYPKQNVQWLITDHPDPDTKITVIDKDDLKWTSQFHSPDWILRDQGHGRRFDFFPIPSSPQIWEHCESTYGKKKYCLVTGHEKPHILYQDNQWWSTHLDHFFQVIMGGKNVEPFFSGSDTKLAIKQAHMLKNWVKNHIGSVPNGWNSWANLGKHSIGSYSDYALACGRDCEITMGASFFQKNNHISFLTYDAKFLVGQKQTPLTNKFLSDNLKSKTSSVKNFHHGWLSLQNDRTLLEYMLNHKLLHDTNQPMVQYNGILSKKYSLGT